MKKRDEASDINRDGETIFKSVQEWIRFQNLISH